MDNKEKSEIYRKNLVELEEKINQLQLHKLILANILDELKKGTNIKLNSLFYGPELQEEISYLNDWVEFYSGNIKRYETKSKILEQKSEKDAESLFKFVFKEAEEKPKNILKIPKIKLVKYSIPFLVILAIAASLLLFKPGTTGYVIIGKETSYTENLNLEINESGTYEWQLKNPGSIKSLKASGTVIGNGTVKVYIEKDGKRYLIYENKQ